MLSSTNSSMIWFIKSKDMLNDEFHAKSYVRKRDISFQFQRFLYGNVNRLKTSYAPIIRKSVEYLDLALHHDSRGNGGFSCMLRNHLRVFNMSSWYRDFPGIDADELAHGLREKDMRENKKELLDNLGIEWDRRMDGMFINRALEPYKKMWFNYQCRRFLMMWNNIKLKVSQAIDKTAAIRKFCKPLGLCMKLPHTSEDDQNILMFFLQILKECSEDSELVSDILRVFKDKDVRRFLLFEVDTEMLKYLLHHSNRARFNLWGILPSVRDHTGHVMTDFFVKNNLEAISCLVQHGANIGKAAFMVPNKQFTQTSTMRSLGRYVCYVSPFRINWEGRTRREMLMNQIVFFAKMADQKKMDAEEAKACLQLIWKSIPDPYPNREELSDHMATTCEWMERLAKSYWSTVKMVCDFFEEAVSKNTQDLSRPRSLMQLSRCVIRQQLLENSQLPQGIKDLTPFDIIEDYLTLEY